jgi:hypothetical protein
MTALIEHPCFRRGSDVAIIGFCNVIMLFDFVEGLRLHYLSIDLIGPLLAIPRFPVDLNQSPCVCIHLLPHLHLLILRCNVPCPPTCLKYLTKHGLELSCEVARVSLSHDRREIPNHVPP